MSCSKCGSTTAGCGCKDTAYTTPTVTTCVPACPPKCAEYVSATCVLMQDGIDELGSNPGDTLESIIQRLTLIITNPLCVDWNPGSGGGGGGGGGGIVQVGLVAPSNLFETPIVPVTTPGGDLTLTLNDQNANTVFAGPASGPANTPQFRALVIDDLPDLTVGNCVLMGDGAGKFACVTIGPNLSFSGGVLDANINVVIGADNGLTKDPLNTDTVWLGGPVSNPGTLIQETFIDTTNQWRLNLYGNNPASKRGVLEVEHTSSENAIKAIADTGTAVSANTIGGVAVYASDTGNGVALLAESSSGLAISYTATNSQGIVGDSALENNLIITSLTPPDDSTISSVLRLSKVSNATSAAGFGSQLTFSLSNASNIDTETSSIVSVFTNPTAPSETADLEFSIIGGGAIETVGRFIGDTGLFNGQFQLIKYGANTFNVGTPLYGLAVDGSGKVMEVPLASGLGTVDNGLSLNPSVSSEAWLGGTLVNPAGTTITVPDGIDFTISGNTTTASKAVLVVENNAAGITGTGALRVLHGGNESAVNIILASNTTGAGLNITHDGTSSSKGMQITSKGQPALFRTNQATNNTKVEMLELHNQATANGGNGIGGFISLKAASATNASRDVAQISYQFTDVTDLSRKGQLEFSTANPTLAQRMIIKNTGQIQFNNYTTATSFTTAVGASLLGIDTSGNVVNSVGAEGLSFNSSTGNVELGRSALAGTSDFSNSRFINSGTEQITLSGTREVAAASGTGLQNAAILRVLNTNTTTQSTVGIYAETVATYNDVTNIPGSAAIMGVAGGTGEDVVGVYGLNTSSNLNSVAIRGQASTGIAGRFVASGNATSLIATSSATTGTNGVAAIRAENTGSGDANKIIDVLSVTRAPSGVVTPGGGAAISYELNAQGGSGIERPDVVRLAAYSVDLSVAPGSHKTGFRIEVMHDSAVPTERINFYGVNIIKLAQNLPGPFVDDIAASTGGVPQYALYRDASSNVKICQI